VEECSPNKPSSNPSLSTAIRKEGRGEEGRVKERRGGKRREKIIFPRKLTHCISKVASYI
jgi:hypothetical protein